MTVVKGSKQERMVVVPYRPLKKLAMRVVFVVAIAIVCFVSFRYGYFDALKNQQQAIQERDQLQLKTVQSAEEIKGLVKRVAQLTQAGIVDRKANEEVRHTVKTLNDKIFQLEQDIVFYKKVMSPDSNEKGLVIGQLDINATDNSRRFKYRAVLKQLGAAEKVVQGYVNINIIGRRNAEETSIPLRELSINEEHLNIKLRFKYFQNIVGELEVPDDFIPDKVQIVAVSKVPFKKKVSKNFSWVVQGS